MRTSFLASTIAITSAIAMASPAAAAGFRFESSATDGKMGNSRAGTLTHVETTFDTETEEFFWSSTFEAKNNVLADGGWLVISPGDNPKGDAQEYVMFYMDGTQADDGSYNNKVSMYVYNGKNSSNSFEDNIYLGSTDLNVVETDNERTFSFGLDMTYINSKTDDWVTEDWVGTAFGEKVGIWFHGAAGIETDYDENGYLTAFEYDIQGWYDTGHLETEKVPEPGLMLGLGVAAVAAKRLRRSA